jgi:hypothetical protein
MNLLLFKKTQFVEVIKNKLFVLFLCIFINNVLIIIVDTQKIEIFRFYSIQSCYKYSQVVKLSTRKTSALVLFF